jgi:Protein of unknown function (DUF4019)
MGHLLNPQAFLRHTPALLLALLVGGCSSPEISLAEKEVAQFHAMSEQGRAAEIYVRASPRFQSVGTEAEFRSYLDAVHRKLGAMRTTEKQQWRVDYNTAGRFASLRYRTVFERGEAYEQFVYLIDSGKATIVSYNINSPALVIR